MVAIERAAPGGRGPGLLSMIEAAVSSRVLVHFLPTGVSTSLRDLWADGGRAAAWLAARLGPDGAVGVVLDSSPAAIAVLLGAWRSGRRVVSLPLPPRGASPAWYQAFVEEACRSCEVTTLLVAGALVPLLPPMTVAVEAFETAVEVGTPGGFDERAEDGQLVQFTSGSTADPKGVVLGMGELGANVRAVNEVNDPRPGDGLCSWLPLSHDMGLIGALLGSLCAGAPEWAGDGDLVLIDPAWFLRRPEDWLRACSTFGSTITAAPDFGFSMALRRRDALGPVDLGRLRVCITGAEPVRAATLRSFAEAFGPSGFDQRAFSPAYGFAEAGVGVTMTRPGVCWSAVQVDPEALAGGVVELADGGRELVSCGEALPGYSVRIEPSAEFAGAPPVGSVSVTGPSLFRRYIPGAVREGAWFETNDLGFVHNGELFVTGRRDDVVLLGGRNVYLSDIDAAASAAAGVSPGRVQTTASDGGYAVVAEAVGPLSPPDLARTIRLAAVGSAGWNPDEVVIIERGSLPRTASGKPRRRELARGLQGDDLPVIHRSRSGGNPS